MPRLQLPPPTAPMRPSRGILSRLIGALFIGCVWTATAHAWTREAYFWQRQSSSAADEAIEQFSSQLDSLHILAAEISWKDNRPHIVQPKRDWAALAHTGKPIGLVLRIGPYSGPFREDDTVAHFLTELAARLVDEARSAGLKPSELQIDFDCAESKLTGYRLWLGAIRQTLRDTPLIFTALPAWLRHEEEFSALARSADGFVLQVHSLEKPESIDAPVTLCDPAQSLRWAALASRTGVPYRIALPTYGYLLAFHSDGTFRGLAADGPRRIWPTDTQLRVIRSDPVALAALAADLAARPPENCTGIIWFRLPVRGDRLNWDATTFNLVIRGETPRKALRAETVAGEDGVSEIVLINDGQTSEPPPARITVSWPADARPAAVDGLGGYRLDVRPAAHSGDIINIGVPPDYVLPPGRRLTVAWLRFSNHDLPLQTQIEPSTP